MPKYSDYYVYTHQKATTGEVFYVGLGQGRRAWLHGKANRSEFWKRIADRHGVVVKIVESGLQQWAACEIEMQLIALYGRRDLGHGPLVNLTDGGEGWSGGSHTKSHKQYMSEKLKGRVFSEKTIQKFIAFRNTPEYKAEVSRRMKGRVVSEETRRKFSLLFKGKSLSKPMSEDHRAKLALTKIGKLNPAAKPVIEIESGTVFESGGEAARWLISKGFVKARGCSLWRNIAVGKRYNGFMFAEHFSNEQGVQDVM